MAYNEYKDLNEFEGFGTNRNFDPLVTGHTFVFFTRPRLNVLDVAPTDTKSDEYMLKRVAYNNVTNRDKTLNMFGHYDFGKNGHAATLRDRTLLQYLSYYYTPTPNVSGPPEDLTNKNVFIPLLTNRAKNFEPKDIMLETFEMYQTRDQQRILLPYTAIRSLSADQFSISFDDTDNADITKMMYLWVQYISGINKGTLIANQAMIDAGVYDFFSSMYFFKLSSDCTRLLYWAKYTGVFPINVPFSTAFRDSKGQRDIAEVNISFGYSFKEEYTLDILKDFNIVSLKLDEQKNQTIDYDNILLSDTIVSASNGRKPESPVICATTKHDVANIKEMEYSLYINSMIERFTNLEIFETAANVGTDMGEDASKQFTRSHYIDINSLYGYDYIIDKLIAKDNENNTNYSTKPFAHIERYEK